MARSAAAYPRSATNNRLFPRRTIIVRRICTFLRPSNLGYLMRIKGVRHILLGESGLTPPWAYGNLTRRVVRFF